jgi:Flp pilus assembly protein TadD
MEPAEKPNVPELPKKPEQGDVPAPRQPPFFKDVPRPASAESDPKEECKRLLELGKAALVEQQAGRAVERFRQAIEQNAKDASAHFLLAQGLWTLGKFHQAADEIREGLRLQPDWPKTDWPIRQFHGTHDGDLNEAFETLHKALIQKPDDKDLLFLKAYILWFDGRRDDAVFTFVQARDAGADKAFVDLFSKAHP